jgi:hypothetical protein
LAVARERAGQDERAGRRLATAVNLALRLSILYFTLEAVVAPDDPRFDGKNLGARNLLILLGFSLLFPALQIARRRWERYPVWFDNLYLSMFWMDMLGNSLGLFDRYSHFDLWPHFYGPGAVAVVLAGAFNLPLLAAWLTVQALHALLELQEWVGDLLFGTRNVRGWWDSVLDLTAGLAGATLCLSAFCCWRSPRKRAAERGERPRRPPR